GIEAAVDAHIVRIQGGVLGMDMINRASVSKNTGRFNRVDALPKEVRGIEVGPEIVSRQATQVKEGLGIVDAETGMRFEGDTHAFIAGRGGFALPVGYEDFLPLIFQDLWKIGRPGTRHPVGRAVSWGPSRAPAERANDGDTELGCETHRHILSPFM